MNAPAPSLFQLIQTVLVVAGFLLAALTFWRNMRAQQASNYLALVKSNREIWQMAIEDESLQDILSHKPELWTKNISFKEAQFLKFIFLHLSSSYHLSKAGSLVAEEGLTSDIQEFLQLPIPARFWEENKKFYNRNFVTFVEATKRPAKIATSQESAHL